MNINLHIDRIVLDGSDFADVHPEDIRAAVVSSLKSRISNQELPIQTGFNAYRIRGPELANSPSTTALAGNLASAITSSMSSR